MLFSMRSVSHPAAAYDSLFYPYMDFLFRLFWGLCRAPERQYFLYPTGKYQPVRIPLDGFCKLTVFLPVQCLCHVVRTFYGPAPVIRLRNDNRLVSLPTGPLAVPSYMQSLPPDRLPMMVFQEIFPIIQKHLYRVPSGAVYSCPTKSV